MPSRFSVSLLPLFVLYLYIFLCLFFFFIFFFYYFSLSFRSFHSTSYLQKCQDVNEAYSSSYLTTTSHLLTRNLQYPLNSVTPEKASYYLMAHNASVESHATGTALQTRDLLDFFVMHLSIYERLLKKAKNHLTEEIHKDYNLSHYNPELASSPSATFLSSSSLNVISPSNSALLTPVFHFIQQLENSSSFLSSSLDSSFSKRTIVVMPFVGLKKGTGNSQIGNRFLYLKASFLSFYRFFPKIVLGVPSEKEKKFLM